MTERLTNEPRVAPERLRVMIVDDSALFRQSVTAVFREMPDIEIVGMAKDGREAIEKMIAMRPDVITLDVEMPDMNGIETLRQMQKLKLPTRAIMLSSLTESGAKITLEALFEGAFDFIQKPTGGMRESRSVLQTALAEKLSAFRTYRRSATKPMIDRSTPVAAVATTTTMTGNASSSCQLVLIGLSTGGPQMLRHVVPRIEADFPVPIVIVQHMPAKYTQTMASRLDEVSPITVCEAAEGMKILPGHVYIAPGGQHLKLVKSHGGVACRLTDDPPENGCRPSVDMTMRSAIEIYGAKILGIIMTGMGRDGLAGCRLLVQAGGVVFAQDEETSAVYGMPKAVVDAGLVTRVLPLGKIAPAIQRHVHAYVGGK